MTLVDDRVKKERLVHSNDTFKYQVENKCEVKEWVDQYGVSEDKKTPDQSLQERVHHIKTDTQEKVISSMYDTITKIVHNVCLTHLCTLLDSNGHIRSGQVKEDVIQALRCTTSSTRRRYDLTDLFITKLLGIKKTSSTDKTYI